MAAEVKITADNSQLVTKVDQAIAKLTRLQFAASRASSSAAGIGSSNAVKGAKDLFQPFSAGALTRIGAAGAAVYAVNMAVNKLTSAVATYAKSEFLSSEQRGQMNYIQSFFDDIASRKAEQNAGIITAIGDMFTGGAVTEGGKMEAEGEKKTKTVGLTIARDQAVQAVRNAAMSDEEKLAALVAERSKLEVRLAKETGDQRIKTETEIAAIKLKEDAQRRTVEKSAEAQTEKRKAAIEQFKNAERETAEAAMTPTQKLVALVERRKALEEEIKNAKGDELRQLELGTKKEAVSKEIIQAQLDLGKEGKDMADEAANEKDKAQKKARKDAIDAAKEATQTAITTLEKAQEQADKVKDQEQSKQSLREQVAIAQEKDPKRKKALEREHEIRQKAISIAQETGVDPQAARNVAEMLMPEDEEERTRSGRKKIKGYSGKQRASNPFLNAMSVNKSFGEFFGGGPQGKAAQAKADKKGKDDKPRDPIDILKAQLTALESLTSY